MGQIGVIARYLAAVGDEDRSVVVCGEAGNDAVGVRGDGGD